MKNGFTLIELLVVLVVISLVSAFVIPRIAAPIGNLHLKTAVRRTAATLRYLRSQAVSERVYRVAVFDFEKDRLTAYSRSNPESANADEDAAGKKADLTYDFPEGVRLERASSGEISVDAGTFKIIFSPRGSSSGGEVVLAGSSGRRWSIVVDFVTGMVKLSPLERAGT